VAGLDEAGRGAWAGPVYAAAVVLPLNRPNLAGLLDGVRDSKLLSPVRREALLPVIGRVGRPAHPCSGIRVDVSGLRNGEDATITYGAADNMDRLTGLPLAIGALMLGRGEITRRGVLAPEACVPPDAFIAELAMRGITVYQGDRLETVAADHRGTSHAAGVTAARPAAACQGRAHS